MAVSPTPPPITLLPPPPLPTDAEAVFDAKAGASLTAQAAMVPEVNTALTWVAGAMVDTKGYKDAAAISAGAATDSAAAALVSKNAAAQSAIDAANNGAGQVALATTQAINAANSAAAAESSGGAYGNIAFIQAVSLSF